MIRMRYELRRIAQRGRGRDAGNAGVVSRLLSRVETVVAHNTDTWYARAPCPRTHVIVAPVHLGESVCHWCLLPSVRGQALRGPQRGRPGNVCFRSEGMGSGASLRRPLSAPPPPAPAPTPAPASL